MATFITSKSVDEVISISLQTSTGFFKYTHNGVSSSAFSNWTNATVTNPNGEFTIDSCDSNGNISGYITQLYLNDNQLTSFDGTGLSGLTFLSLYNNQLTTFVGTGMSSLTELELSINQITSFDGTGMSSLTRLVLYDNQLTSFDGTGMSTLTQLILGDNQFTSIDSIDVSEMYSLTLLDLTNNQLTLFDGAGLSGLTNLTLNVSNNPLTSFDGAGLSGLTNLSLTETQLTSFDGTGLSSLTDLTLGYNPLLTSFDGTGLSSLTYIDLSNNPLLISFIGGDLPFSYFYFGTWNITTLTSVDVSGMSNLTQLYLNNNQLTSFVGSSSLTYLNLDNNSLTTFDGTGLSSLTYLNLGNNSLTTFDGTGMSSLNDLNLTNNPLTSFVGGDMSQLTTLDFNGWGITTLTSFDGSGLNGLTYLNLYGNPLTSFVGGDMGKLTELDFGSWNITTLTSFEGSGLTGLTTLYIYNNPSLTSFDCTGLNNLTYISFGSCLFTSLNSFILPSSLTGLDLSENPITSLDLSNLTNLNSLYLTNNQLTSLNGFILPNTITTLNLYLNQLTSLDVSNFPGLNYLELGENPMTPSANNQILQQLNQHGVSNGYFRSVNGRTATSNSSYNNLLNNLTWTLSGLDLVSGPVVGNGKLRVRGVISNPPFIPQEGSFTVNVTGTEYTYLGVGSSTGYIKVRYWNGVEEILGNGDTSTYVPDEYNNPSSMIGIEREITDSTPNKTINYYPCLSDGTMYGDIVYLSTHEDYAYQTVLPQTLKGLWLYSYNRSNTLDLTSLTSLETFIYRDSTTLTTIDLSNISTLKLVMIGNQTESVFPLQNVLISNPSNLEKFKVYGCGISQFDVTTVSNANKLWLEGTSLTSMDLSQSNATELDIRNSQSLTSLSLSTSVNYLSIQNVPLLSNLDLTGLVNLINLGIDNTPSIETLDISDLVSLIGLSLQQGYTPDYSARIPLNITSLDLSNNTSLTHLTYELSIPETLDLTNNNNLIYLSVADATNLTSILGLSDTNIVTFSCSNSQSLDLDSVLSGVNLDQLRLSNVINTTLDLSQQTNLTQLNINNSGLNTLLPLESINLSGLNNLGYIGISKVSGAVLDDALIDLNGNTKTNGYFYNATGRSSDSNSAVSGLVSKGWTVQSW